MLPIILVKLKNFKQNVKIVEKRSTVRGYPNINKRRPTLCTSEKHTTSCGVNMMELDDT